MQNFSAICPAVRRPFQKNSWGVAPPPALAIVNIHNLKILQTISLRKANTYIISYVGRLQIPTDQHKTSARRGARTQDLGIRNPTLYRLS